jgi:hypothetical protein
LAKNGESNMLELEGKPLFQLADCSSRDVTEQIVELYYQFHGYITSSNKWFSHGKGRYKDVDVIAVKEKNVHLVSVSTHVKSKNPGKLAKDFEQIIDYFKKTEHLRWLFKKSPVKVLAIFAYEKSKKETIEKEWDKKGIKILFGDDIFEQLYLEVPKWEKPKKGKPGFKTENQLVKLIQLSKHFNGQKYDREK